MRRILLALILVSLTLAPASTQAYSSNICKPGPTGKCTEGEVGPFMQGISNACGNTGDCTLTDIMQVFSNVGNYILSIIGGIVLLMYVIGGFWMLVSAGDPERVKKGKKYIKISTVGLLIVLFAWTGIYTLKQVLTSGTIYGTSDETEEFTSFCTDATVGWACGDHSTCTEDGLCLSECEQTYPDGSGTYDEVLGTYDYYTCIDTESVPSSYSSESYFYYSGPCTETCEGSPRIQCCYTHFRTSL